MTEHADEKRTPRGVGRILWNERPAQSIGGGGGDIDEIVVRNPKVVHVEQMNDRCWWIGIYLDDDRYWMGNFVADSRGRMRFVEQENADVEWDEDREHLRASLGQRRDALMATLGSVVVACFWLALFASLVGMAVKPWRNTR